MKLQKSYSQLLRKRMGKMEQCRIAKGDAVEEIKKIIQQSGKDITLWASLSLSQSMLAAHLIDELEIRIIPYNFRKRTKTLWRM